jgi:hypothetical protein
MKERMSVCEYESEVEWNRKGKIKLHLTFEVLESSNSRSEVNLALRDTDNNEREGILQMVSIPVLKITNE